MNHREAAMQIRVKLVTRGIDRPDLTCHLVTLDRIIEGRTRVGRSSFATRQDPAWSVGFDLYARLYAYMEGEPRPTPETLAACNQVNPVTDVLEECVCAYLRNHPSVKNFSV